MCFLILLFKTQSLEKIKQMDICRDCFQLGRKTQIQRRINPNSVLHLLQGDRHDILVRLLSGFSDQTVFTAVVTQQKGECCAEPRWVLFNLCTDEKLDHLRS